MQEFPGRILYTAVLWLGYRTQNTFQKTANSTGKEGPVLGDAFKALADPSRRRILELLAEGDLSAGEIAAHFDMAKPSVSHHLSILRNAGLITDERQGQSIIYHLNLTVMQELMKWFYDFELIAGGDTDETKQQ